LIALQPLITTITSGDPPKQTDKYVPGGSFEDNIFFLVKKKSMYIKLSWKEHYSWYIDRLSTPQHDILS
jgi:hypothetical protein